MNSNASKPTKTPDDKFAQECVATLRRLVSDPKWDEFTLAHQVATIESIILDATMRVGFDNAKELNSRIIRVLLK